jgi:hypothetical protein
MSVSQWIPNNLDLVTLPIGIHVFSTNPSNLPINPQIPDNANRYGILMLFKANYYTLIYINLMGELYFRTNSSDWKKIS